MSPLKQPMALLLALVLLALGAAALRCHPSVMTTDATGMHFRDPDTVRRLVKLNSMAGADHYPVRELRDGFPEGATIQWSLPMDWVIRFLDAVAPPIHAKARPNETGAALAGPVLGTLAVIAFALLVWRLLPRGQAALASLLYAVSAPGIEVTRLGNGDHQSLQLLCIVVAVLGCLAVVTGRGGKVLAVLAGAALGLSLWVNAESMLAMVIDALMILVGLALSDRDAVLERLPRVLWFAAACAAVALPGQLIENGGALTLEWDRISCFQGAASLGLVLFVWLARTLVVRQPRPAVALLLAAAASTVIVAGPFLAVPALRHALTDELSRAATFAGFCMACVAEYHRLFWRGLNLPLLVYGWTFFLIPLCFVGLFWARALGAGMRWCLVIPTVLLGALVVDQVKLAHMFALPWALIMPAGGAGCLDRLERTGWIRAASMPRVRLVAGLLLAVLVIWHILTQTFRSDPVPGDDTQAVVAAVRDLQFTPRSEIEAERTAVMAPWDLGHYLLYGTDKPIVASSYQRRVDGIRDSFDAMCSQNPAEVREILRRRRVRWWIRQGDPSYLLQYHLVVPGRPELGRAEPGEGEPNIRLSQDVLKTFWARTAPGQKLPDWLEPVYQSPTEGRWWNHFGGPQFRVFRVRYDDEPK
jgi:asparagine N-glycosylation enzyme membrane subunit Stt3